MKISILFLAVVVVDLPALAQNEMAALSRETGRHGISTSWNPGLAAGPVGVYFKRRSWEFKDLFEEPEMFEDKSWAVQLGAGFRSDVKLKEAARELDQLDATALLPALSLTIEKNTWKNLGLGLTLGAQAWRVPVFGYQYHYYAGSLRGAYHLNVHERLDPYLGLAFTFRYLELRNGNENVHNTKIAGAWLLGARYYLNGWLGGFLEIGDDALSWFKGGLVIYLP